MKATHKKPQISYLACTACQTRNYTTPKTRQLNAERLELKKYCPHCSIHTLHRETK